MTVSPKSNDDSSSRSQRKHFAELGQGMALEEGMIFTIEPMINAGRPETKVLEDGWTTVTRD